MQDVEEGQLALPVGDRVVRWQQRGDQILLRDVNYDIRADIDDPIKLAVEATSVEPIIHVFDVRAYGKDRAPVIAVSEFFKSDKPEFSAKDVLGVKEIDSKRSFIEEANLEWAYKQFIGDEALHRAIMMANHFIQISQEETGVPWHEDKELRREASEVYWIQLDTEAAKLSADVDKVPSGKTRKRPARKRAVRK